MDETVLTKLIKNLVLPQKDNEKPPRRFAMRRGKGIVYLNQDETLGEAYVCILAHEKFGRDNFLIDAALLYQARRVNIAFQEQGLDPDVDYGEQQPGGAIYDGIKLFNGLSLNVVAGYKLWKGLNAGVGVEPTVYFNTTAKANLEDNKFDIPLVVKVGYDFNWFQVDLSYKNGFNRIYRNHVVGSTGTRDLQLSIFVPIFK